jgi:hypothetical protein
MSRTSFYGAVWLALEMLWRNGRVRVRGWYCSCVAGGPLTWGIDIPDPYRCEGKARAAIGENEMLWSSGGSFHP